MTDNPYAPPDAPVSQDPSVPPQVTPPPPPYGQQPAGPPSWAAPTGPASPGAPPSRGISPRAIVALAVGTIGLLFGIAASSAAFGNVSSDVYEVLTGGMSGAALLGFVAVATGVSSRVASSTDSRWSAVATIGTTLGAVAIALSIVSYIYVREDLDAYQRCLKVSITFVGDDQCVNQLRDGLGN